jgi:hypothetical protein
MRVSTHNDSAPEKRRGREAEMARSIERIRCSNPHVNVHSLKYDTMLRRLEVARLFGCDKRTVMRYEEKGLLHPIKDPGTGILFYEANEVEQLKVDFRRRGKPLPELQGGELAAALFEKFDRGLTVRQLVKEFRLEPQVIDRYYAAWAEPNMDRRNGERKRLEEEQRQAERDERELRFYAIMRGRSVKPPNKNGQR